MAVRHELRIDPVACDGYGHCAEVAPELFSLDEWGYPILRGTQVPPALLGVARLAVKQCPRKALHLVQPVDAPTRRR
jgi:ferredoxin